MAIIWITKIRSERPTSCHQSRLLSPPVASGRHPGTGQQPIPRPDPLWAAGRPGTPSSASAPSATNVQTTVSGSTLFFNWIYFNRQLILKIFTNWNHQTLVTGTLRSKTKVQTKRAIRVVMINIHESIMSCLHFFCARCNWKKRLIVCISRQTSCATTPTWLRRSTGAGDCSRNLARNKHPECGIRAAAIPSSSLLVLEPV